MTNGCSDHCRRGGRLKVKKSILRFPGSPCMNVKFKAGIKGGEFIRTLCRCSVSAVTNPLLKINLYFGPDETGAESAGLRRKKGKLVLSLAFNEEGRIFFYLPSCRSRLEMRMKEFIFKFKFSIFQISKLSNFLEFREPFALGRTRSLDADRAIRAGLNTIGSNEKKTVVCKSFVNLWRFAYLEFT